MALIFQLLIFAQLFYCYFGYPLWLFIVAGKMAFIVAEFCVIMSDIFLTIFLIFRAFYGSILLMFLIILRQIFLYISTLNWQIIGLLMFSTFAVSLVKFVGSTPRPTREEQLHLYLAILAERRKGQKRVCSFELQSED